MDQGLPNPPTQGHHKTVTVQGDWVIANPYLLASVSTEEVAVLVIRYSSQYSWVS